jgi:hypothetical protein
MCLVDMARWLLTCHSPHLIIREETEIPELAFYAILLIPNPFYHTMPLLICTITQISSYHSKVVFLFIQALKVITGLSP